MVLTHWIIIHCCVASKISLGLAYDAQIWHGCYKNLLWIGILLMKIKYQMCCSMSSYLILNHPGINDSSEYAIVPISFYMLSIMKTWTRPLLDLFERAAPNIYAFLYSLSRRLKVSLLSQSTLLFLILMAHISLVEAHLAVYFYGRYLWLTLFPFCDFFHQC